MKVDKVSIFYCCIHSGSARLVRLKSKDIMRRADSAATLTEFQLRITLIWSLKNYFSLFTLLMSINSYIYLNASVPSYSSKHNTFDSRTGRVKLDADPVLKCHAFIHDAQFVVDWNEFGFKFIYTNRIDWAKCFFVFHKKSESGISIWISKFPIISFTLLDIDFSHNSICENSKMV